MNFVTTFKCVNLNLDPALKAQFTSLNAGILCHLRFFQSSSWRPGRMPWGHWIFPRSSVITHMALSCFVSESTKCLCFSNWIELRCLAFLAAWSWMRSWIPTPYSLLKSTPLWFEVSEAPVTFSVLTASREGTYLIDSWTCCDLSWLELRHLWEAALLLDIIPLIWSHLSVGHKLPIQNLGGETYRRTRATKHWLSPALEQAALSPFGTQKMAVALFTWWEQEQCSSLFVPILVPSPWMELRKGLEENTSLVLSASAHWQLAVKIRICT